MVSTDWWTDCDDAVALRILLRAHKAGQICIDAIIINACMEYSVSSLVKKVKPNDFYRDKINLLIR